MLKPGMTLADSHEMIGVPEGAPPDITWEIQQGDDVMIAMRRYRSLLNGAIRHNHLSLKKKRKGQKRGPNAFKINDDCGEIAAKRINELSEQINTLWNSRAFSPTSPSIPPELKTINPSSFGQRLDKFSSPCRESFWNALEHGSNFGQDGPVTVSTWFTSEGVVHAVEQPRDWSLLDTHFLAEGREQSISFRHNQDGAPRGRGRTRMVRLTTPDIWCEPLESGGARTVLCAPRSFFLPNS